MRVSALFYESQSLHARSGTRLETRIWQTGVRVRLAIASSVYTEPNKLASRFAAGLVCRDYFLLVLLTAQACSLLHFVS